MSKTCKICGAELDEEQFYHTNNWVRYPDSKLDICKQCIKTKIDAYTGDWVLRQYLQVIKECDVPFFAEIWNNINENNRLDKYLAKMQLLGYRHLRYEDSSEIKEITNYANL